jgi:4-amino-4-deoxy-L-arabinose transferase-like glycosyltransferase
VAALATRFVTFGNPVVIADDQFYLLVGDALRHGQLPYVDIWDRKPFGLFALFAVISGLGNGSILFMQLVAMLFAVATAFVIYRIALYFAGAGGALLAAIAYLPVLALLGGQSGQSPVFYNLFVAMAGWAMLASLEEAPAAIRRQAYGAMLACGLAMAMKPVAFVEGGFIGLAFLWLARRAGASWRMIAAQAAVMVAIALVPTVLPLAGYALAGREAFDAFIYANYVSIFDKLSFGLKARLAGLAYFFLYATPLLLLAALGAVRRWKANGPRDTRAMLLLGWIAAAAGGYLIVPHFFDHYALPMLVPLSISAASAFDLKDGKLYFGGFLLFALVSGPLLDWRGNQRAAADYAQLERIVDQARRGGCLYLADGPSWLYASTGACRVTRFLFPDHLTLYTEAPAVGVDTMTEMGRVLAQRPAVVVTQDNERNKHNPPVERMLSGRLARDYRPVWLIPADAHPRIATVRVWQRKDLAPPAR